MKKFKILWKLAKSANFKKFEGFVKREFNGYLAPHIYDGLERSKSVGEFLQFIKQFN